MNPIKRIKRAWDLSTKDPLTLEKLGSLSQHEIDRIPEVGDGKATFIGEGSEEEYKDQQNADKGLKGIFGL